MIQILHFAHEPHARIEDRKDLHRPPWHSQTVVRSRSGLSVPRYRTISKTCRPLRRREIGRTSRSAWSLAAQSFGFAATEPVERVDRRPLPTADLEMEVRREVGVRPANRADLVPLVDVLTFLHVSPTQRPIHRIVSAAMLDDDGEAICADDLGDDHLP